MTSIPVETSPLYLAEVTVWDPSLGATRVLRYCSKQGFTTKPSETPANAWYNPVLKQPVDVTRNLFTGGNTSGASIVGVGDLVLLNPDGALDDLLLYGFDGQSLVVRVTTTLNPAYPADFTTVFSGTMSGAEFDDQTVTIKVRDLLASLQLPFQTNKYGGTNVLPNGLDGVATDLAGKVKPVLLGTATNFSPPCVNTSKLIYQISDGAISSVDAVYDKGRPVTLGLGNWTAQTSGFGSSAINGLAFGAGLCVAVGASGKLYTSPDGVTWTGRTSGFGTTNINAVTFGGGQFVAVGDSGTLATSPDGITWTVQTSGFSATAIRCVAYGNGLYVTGGDSGKLFTSPDAIAWTARTSGFGTSAIFGVVYGVGAWVAVGAVSTGASSTDGGVTWTVRSTLVNGPGLTYRGVTYGAAGFVVVGDTAAIYTSPDGAAWTIRALFTTVPSTFGTSNLLAIAYGNGRYLVVSGDGKIGYSGDGVAWVISANSYAGASINAVVSAPVFITAGASGLLETSAGVKAYSTLADLQDDTQEPAPGTYGYYLAGGYIRLGSPAIGTITCDATQGATSADRTAAQLFKLVLERAGYASGDINATDLMTLDGLNSAELGIYIDADTTFANVIDQIAGTVGAGYWPSAAGQWRIKRIDAPTGTPLLSLGPNDIKQPLQIVPTTDAGDGVPAYRCTVNWGRNYTVQTTDLATGVTDDRRAVVAQQWRAAVSTDLSVQTAHPLSPSLSKDTLFSTAADAQTEADRWQTLMGAQRYRGLVVVPMTSDTIAVDLSDVVSLRNNRFGLNIEGSDDGALFRVLDVQPDAANEAISLTLWGRGAAGMPRNRVTTDGAFRATTDGTLRLTAAVA